MTRRISDNGPLIIMPDSSHAPQLLNPPSGPFHLPCCVARPCDQTSTDARAFERPDTARLLCSTWKERRPIPFPSLLPEVEYLAVQLGPASVGLPTTRYRRGMEAHTS